MDGINRDFNTQAIELRIKIKEAEQGGVPLTDQEKQEIINSQLKSKIERQKEMQAINKSGSDREDQESSSDVSSNWDDWQDEDYIEEQRKALQDFEKKQKEIKQKQRKKKKKKSKKKKGQRAGDALNMDDDQSEYSQYTNAIPGQDGGNNEREQEEFKNNADRNMSRTRLAADE